MKNTSTLLLLGCFCTQLLASNFQPKVDALLNHIDPHINLSALVVDLNTGETLYQHNASNALLPASNMKLFSDAAALLALGPDYQFNSQLWIEAGRLEQGVLHGAIYLYLPGDPSFKSQHLDALIAQLVPFGIQQIEGNVVIVSDHQVVDAYAPGWVTRDLNYSYGAPLAPVILDENRITITVNPGAKVNELAWIETSDADSTMPIHNEVKTTAHAEKCGVYFSMNDQDQLTLRGCIGHGEWAVMQRIPIQNPLIYTQNKLKARLKAHHIELHGDVVLGPAPKKPGLLVATHASKPISQLMADTLKPSDNLYADSLYLHAASRLNGGPVNWNDAQPVIKRFLTQQTGIDLTTATLIDGSGLSRDDRLSAEQTVGLLRYLHAQFPLSFEYIAALPIAGQDGTLQKRLKKPSEKGFVRAKTGYMTGVTSLSGYLYTANAHTLAFALFINRQKGSNPQIAGGYRGLIDHLCAYFLQQKPDSLPAASLSNAHEHVAFQQHPTINDIKRAQQGHWRAIEYGLKQALKHQSIGVLFRNDQLIIHDHNNNGQSVWRALNDINKKYHFSVSLIANTAPDLQASSPPLLWIKPSTALPQNERIWTLHRPVQTAY
jgi:D-alanyl-D-alanine carboxypeptidase/D-alanyl-D-alanine-endopeptidase (penicillin-binding protein 4)